MDSIFEMSYGVGISSRDSSKVRALVLGLIAVAIAVAMVEQII